MRSVFLAVLFTSFFAPFFALSASANPELTLSKSVHPKSSPVEVAQSKIVQINTHQSGLEWLGKKILGQHSGTLRLKSGQVKLEDGKPVSGKFEVDMQSIVVSDIKDPKDNQKLTGHLKSEDFFGASLFPVTIVELTKFEPIANAQAGQPNYNVTGNVSIKGISQPITFPATIDLSEGTATAKAVVTLDRTKFNVRYGSNKFFDNLGDKVISDNFDVTVNLVGEIS